MFTGAFQHEGRTHSIVSLISGIERFNLKVGSSAQFYSSFRFLCEMYLYVLVVVFKLFLHCRLISSLNLFVPNPEEVYTSQDLLWKKFESIFPILMGLVTYTEAFKAYYLETLSEFYADNVQYMEIRALLPSVSLKVEIFIAIILRDHPLFAMDFGILTPE